MHPRKALLKILKGKKKMKDHQEYVIGAQSQFEKYLRK